MAFQAARVQIPHPAPSKKAGEKWVLKSFLETLHSEHNELFNQTAEQLGMITTFGDIKLTVIAAGRPNPLFGEYAESYQEYWIEESRILSELSNNGEFILVEDSRHHIHRDAPGLVIDQILRRVR